jgi:hypothetical protein
MINRNIAAAQRGRHCAADARGAISISKMNALALEDTQRQDRSVGTETEESTRPIFWRFVGLGCRRIIMVVLLRQPNRHSAPKSSLTAKLGVPWKHWRADPHVSTRPG